MIKLDVREMTGMANNYADNYLAVEKPKWKLLRNAYVEGFSDAIKILNERIFSEENEEFCKCKNPKVAIMDTSGYLECGICGLQYKILRERSV